MLVKVPGAGPQPSKILLIGEAPGKEEDETGKPFVGRSGQELTKMLNEAQILRTECRVTNVCKYRPPRNDISLWWELHDKGKKKGELKLCDPRVEEGLAELRDEIARTQPNVIVPLGNLPLWACTGNTGITKWRSSLLHPQDSLGCSEGVKVIPTLHPAAILRKWDWRYLAVHDLRRAKRWSEVAGFPEITRHFQLAPSFSEVVSRLEWLLAKCDEGPTLLAFDIETWKRRYISCLGLAWSKEDAICIPFLDLNKPAESVSFFSLEEETHIVLLLRKLATHPNCQGVGQNWQYDARYIGKNWGFELNLFLDCMLEHHTQFPGLPKSLDFQSALYRDIHIYWKDDGKEQGGGSSTQWWSYNCEDCVATYEVAEVLLASRNMRPLRATSYGTPNEIQQRLNRPMLYASMRGVRKDHEYARRVAFMIQEDMASTQGWINRVLGFEFNPNSNPQLQKLFYEDLKQPKILNRKTGRPTCDDEALDKIAERTFVLRPLCQAINHFRSLRNCLSVALQPTDSDGRLRCAYNLGGTETFRFSSSQDPFGFGGNLQNITSGERADKDFPLPNLRKMFLPDEGYVIGEFDLPQADARVVAWEAGDEDLIELFSDPTRHLHMENAEVIFGKRPAKSDPQYYYAKQGVHLTNYGGTPRVLAMTLGITMREAEHFQNRWFQKHPKIKEWQRKILMQLQTRRYVENAYGFRRFYFDRIDDLLKEALAWIPQSTVAIATNLGILAVEADDDLRTLGTELLLQVHDSSVFQWPIRNNNLVLPRMLERVTISVPYPQPLVFEGGAKISTKSWGDLEEVKNPIKTVPKT